MDFNNHATTDFEFREGKQWTTVEIAELTKRGQAATVENEIKPIIDRLIGLHKKQKTRIIYRGRNLGPDETQANVLTDLALYIHQKSGYEFEEGDMFDDGSVSGFGVLELFVEFDEILQPSIKIKHENSLNISPDPNSKRYDWNEDAEYICRYKWMSLKKAQKKWPAHANDLANLVNQNPVVNATQQMENKHYVDYRLQRLRPVEVWYKTYKLKRIAFGGDIGEPLEITDLSKKKEKELRAKFPNIQVLEKIETKMKMGIFCFNILLKHQDSPHDHNLFPFVPYFVYRKKNGEPYGVTRALIDSSVERNKRRSKALHLLTTNQTFCEEGAIRDKDLHAKEMAKPDGILEFRKGSKWEIQKNIEVAQSQMTLHAESGQAMHRISNLPSQALAGQPEIRSGIGVQRLQAWESIPITPIFDNLRRTRLMVGRLQHELIKQYITEAKIFYVTDDTNKSREVKLTKEGIEAIKSGIYDMIVEEAPDTTTMQDEEFRKITELLQSMNLPPNMAMALMSFIIPLSTLRDKEEVLKRFEELSQPRPEAPKASLNIVWSELPPEQQFAFANTYGLEQLAQAVATSPKAPAHVIKEQAGIQKVGMKVEGDITKELIKEDKKDGEGNKDKS